MIDFLFVKYFTGYSIIDMVTKEKKEENAMTAIQKPAVFFVGKKKPDAPPEPVISKEFMEKCIEDAKKLFSEE